MLFVCYYSTYNISSVNRTISIQWQYDIRCNRYDLHILAIKTVITKPEPNATRVHQKPNYDAIAWTALLKGQSVGSAWTFTYAIYLLRLIYLPQNSANASKRPSRTFSLA